MPTNIIWFAGFPAPRQFISVLPHFPKAKIGQGKTDVNHSWRVQLLILPRNSRWPSTEGMGKCPIALEENQRQPAQLRERQFIALVGRLIDTPHRDASGVSALQHSARPAIPPAPRRSVGATRIAIDDPSTFGDSSQWGVEMGTEPNLTRDISICSMCSPICADAKKAHDNSFEKSKCYLKH